MKLTSNNVTIELTEKQIEEVIQKYGNLKSFDYRDIKSFEDALKYYNLDEDEKELLNYSGANKKILSTKSKLRLEIIIEVINSKMNFIPNYSDSNQKKWYPYFRYDSSTNRFGFSDSYYDCTIAGSHSGVRCVLSTEEISNYIGKIFINEFNNILL